MYMNRCKWTYLPGGSVWSVWYRKGTGLAGDNNPNSFRFSACFIWVTTYHVSMCFLFNTPAS